MLTLILLWLSMKYDKEYFGMAAVTAFLDICLIFTIAAVVSDVSC